MEITGDQRRLLALCAIRVDQEILDWSLIAREAQFPEGLEGLWSGAIQEKSIAADRALPMLRSGIRTPEELFDRVDVEVAAATTVGARLVTVLEQDYPAHTLAG